MLPENLLLDQYYINKLSLFMQNDETFCIRLKSAIALVRAVDATADNIASGISLLIDDIIDDSISEVSQYEYTDLLNKLAGCFGLKRKFKLDFSDDAKAIIAIYKQKYGSNIDVPESVNLSNNQLRCLIYCTIMKNAYDGSKKSVKQLYSRLSKFYLKNISDSTIGSTDPNAIDAYEVDEANKISITIAEITSDSEPGSCSVWFNFQKAYNFSNPVMNQYISLFLAGLFNIESAGIKYTDKMIQLSNIMLWAAINDSGALMKWDGNSWL